MMRAMAAVLVVTFIVAVSDVAGQKGCYTCKGADPRDPENGPCNTCPLGPTGLFVSCIPYCDNSCHVGTGEGCGAETFRTIRVAPDGSLWQAPVLVATHAAHTETLQSGTYHVERACGGLVSGRLRDLRSRDVVVRKYSQVVL